MLQQPAPEEDPQQPREPRHRPPNMSKMPAKKKSCFQITSVTQAQVAGVGATDDTESLDDPDESRPEDVSSEIYDMTRAEYEPVEAEAHMLPSNPLGEFRKVGLTQGGQQPPGPGGAPGLPFIAQPGAPAAGVPANTSQPAVATSSAPPPSTSTVSCMSRFRVIKLDHGTGEPFRRGRWTCTEFYEKDSSGSAGSRTVDSIRHANATTLDPAADRDSGLGQTGGSVVALVTHSGQGLGSVADASQSSSSMHPVETLPQQQQQQQQIHHQSYSARQPGVSGSPAQSAFSSSKPTAVPAQQQAQPAAASLQPSAPQSVLPVGQNGLPQSAVHIQKSPIMPSTAQPVTYPPQQQQHQQLPMGHHLSSQPPGLVQNQMEYYQQQLPGLVTGQSLTVSVGPQTVGQVPSAIMPAPSGGISVPGQVGDVAGAGGGSIAPGQLAQSLVQQQTVGVGDISSSMLVVGSTLQQQYATAEQPPPHSLHPTSSGVQNVPAIAASSSVPTTVPTAVPSASSAAMPNVTTSSLPPGQIPYSKTPGAFGAQGLLAAGFGQVEGGGGRKSEGLINTQSLVSGKEPMKPFMPESLQVATPTVNSLFGIHIPVDGDEDRNPSKAFYQAFQYGSRIRDSKAHSDSASGISIVAIDNKIEQAMDLVKSHLMYAVREEVEVLKEQIKELFERNSVLERENAVLKSLANNDQLSQLSTQLATSSSTTPPQQGLSQPQPLPPPQPQQQAQPPLQVQQPQLLSQQQAPLQVQLASAAVPPAVPAAASTPAAAVAALAPGSAPASSLAAPAAVTHPAPMPP